MPRDPVAYVPQPFVRPEYVQDTRSLRDLLQMASQARQQAILQRGQLQGQGRLAIGALVADALGSIRDSRQRDQALKQQQAFAQQKLAQEEQDKQRTFALQAAQFEDLAAQRQAQQDQINRLNTKSEAQDAVENTQPGLPMDAAAARTLRAYPGTAPMVSDQMTLPARAVTPDQPEMGAPTPTGMAVRGMTSKEATQTAAAEQAQRLATAAALRQAAMDKRQELMDRNTIRHQNVMENRPTGSSQPAVFPGNWDATGEDFLKSLPAQDRDLVKKIANYDLDPSKVASMRGNNRERMMAMVSHLNPAYDQSQFALRSPTRKAYTIGTQGQQINAINTALGHIDQLDTLVTALGNKSFVPGNELANWASKTFGQNKVTNFDTLKDALSAEVASVLSKGQATVSEIAEQRQKINAASSPAQLVGYIKTQIPIMGSKLASLDYQYHQAMGPDDSFSALSPQSKSILDKHGFDYNAHSSSQTAPAIGNVVEYDMNGKPIKRP